MLRRRLSLAAPPDGSRIYVGGDFTTVNGTSRSRIAALDPTTGALMTQFERSDGRERRGDRGDLRHGLPRWLVQFGELDRSCSAGRGPGDRWRSAVLGSPGRQRTGQRDADVADRRQARGRRQLHDAERLRSSRATGWVLSPTGTGALTALAANNMVRNAGNESAILSLASDATNVYGTGYIFGTGGNLEGAFSAHWDRWGDHLGRGLSRRQLRRVPVVDGGLRGAATRTTASTSAATRKCRPAPRSEPSPSAGPRPVCSPATPADTRASPAKRPVTAELLPADGSGNRDRTESGGVGGGRLGEVRRVRR